LQTHKAKQKKAKEPPSQRTKTAVATDKQAKTEKDNEGITRVWQKWRFSASYDSFSYI
jgi:hypothetical protein